MKRFLATLGILVCLHSVVLSDNSATFSQKAPVQKIAYVRCLPVPVARRMPRGAKSCFAGWFKLTSQKPDLFLHLYNRRPTELVYDSGNSHVIQYNFSVDIFRAEKTNSTRFLRLIQRFPLTYSGAKWPPKKFGASLLWLDPKERKKPILKFDFFSNDDYLLGYNVLATFTKGVSTKPAVQSFVYGFWRASDTSGQDNLFDEIDANGLLQVTTLISIPTDEIPPPPNIIYRWNGKEFAPVVDEKKSDPDSDESSIDKNVEN